MAVAAEVEDDDLFFPALPALDGLIDGDPDGMGRLRSGNRPFGSGEQHRRFENGVLRDGHRLDQAFIYQEAEQGSGPVVAQTAGVDPGGMKLWPKVCIIKRGVICAVSPKS